MPDSEAVIGDPVDDDPVVAQTSDAPVAEDGEVPPAPIADPVLVAAHDLALRGLKEITPESTIGPAAGYTVEADGVVSLRFENRLPGYPGWYWTVSLARVGDEDPTILEAELLPGESALLAPEWVPWAVRLAEYRAQQAAAAAAEAESEDDAEDLEDDLEDVDDLDAADFDTDGSPILHAGDVDGVDIDELDEDARDDEEDDEDSDDEPDDDEGDESDDDDASDDVDDAGDDESEPSVTADGDDDED